MGPQSRVELEVDGPWVLAVSEEVWAAGDPMELVPGSGRRHHHVSM